MFTYHGWIELRHSELEKDFIETKVSYPAYRDRLLSIAEELLKISESDFNISNINLSVIAGTNGIIAVHMSGQHNHYSFGVEDLLNWIKEKAPLSHGLIYLTDSEVDYMNGQYKILRLAQNSISEMDDIFLSPFHKMIE